MEKNISKWFRYQGNHEDAEGNIFCFPHAGSSASFFAKWKTLIDKKNCIFPVQYPGRENRRNEKFDKSINTIAEEFVKDNIEILNSKPYVIFGHCMGSLIGWEVVKAVKRFDINPPKALIVSSSAPPDKREIDNAKGLSDDEMIEQLCKMGYIDKAITVEKEFFNYYISIMKTDKEMLDFYDYEAQNGIKSGCPIISFNGKEDDKELLIKSFGWSEFTDDKFEQALFNGGHFYLNNNTEDTIKKIETYL